MQLLLRLSTRIHQSRHSPPTFFCKTPALLLLSRKWVAFVFSYFYLLRVLFWLLYMHRRAPLTHEKINTHTHTKMVNKCTNAHAQALVAPVCKTKAVLQIRNTVDTHTHTPAARFDSVLSAIVYILYLVCVCVYIVCKLRVFSKVHGLRNCTNTHTYATDTHHFPTDRITPCDRPFSFYQHVCVWVCSVSYCHWLSKACECV